MENLNNYITEKLKVNSKSKVNQNKYTCQPNNRNELLKILVERLTKDKNADLNDIDISKITSLNFIFKNLDPYNIKIDNWDTSNVFHMDGVFYGCKNFNCNLSHWDVSNVQDMYATFYGCKKFIGEGLENWNPKTCINFNYTFEQCTSLKNIPDWYKK